MKKRNTELDVLRLMAALAVIMIHAGLRPQTDSEAVKRTYWGIHAAIVWCVPVFFMISGRFFLDPERNVDTRKLLTRYIPHLMLTFVVWSGVYTGYCIISGVYDQLNIFGILTEFIHGPSHLWFLYSLAGLYLLTPVLRKIAADEKTLSYFLILFFAVNVTFEYLIYIPKIGGIIEEFTERLGLRLVTGYVGYFMLGYYLYLKKDNIRGRAEIAVYVLGLLMLIATIAAECLGTPEMRETDFVKQYLKPNVILYSAVIYTVFIKRVASVNFSERVQRLFAGLTECGLGVYCIHAVLNKAVPAQLVPSLPFINSLLRVGCLYFSSLLLTWIIRKIPYIGKKIT